MYLESPHVCGLSYLGINESYWGLRDWSCRKNKKSACRLQLCCLKNHIRTKKRNTFCCFSIDFQSRNQHLKHIFPPLSNAIRVSGTQNAIHIYTHTNRQSCLIKNDVVGPLLSNSSYRNHIFMGEHLNHISASISMQHSGGILRRCRVFLPIFAT